MRVLIDITHPAHVHFFRHAIAELGARGHVVSVTARDKDLSAQLLTEFGIAAKVLDKALHGPAGAPWRILGRDIKLWWHCLRFRPDVLGAISGMFVAHAGWLLRKPVVVWDNAEHQTLAHRITFPFVTAIKSPESYLLRVPKKHHRFCGYNALAYVHRNRFTPDPAEVRAAGIDPEEKYCVVRFVSWSAAHDVGARGISPDRKLRFVQTLARHARVYVTCEGRVPPELKPYRLRIPPGQILHVLAYASLYVGEGATMASEAAPLGTPSVYINTLRCGYIDMLAERGLLRHITDNEEALRQSVRWLTDPDAKVKAAAAAKPLHDNEMDVTADIVRTLETYARLGRNVPAPDPAP